MIRAAGKELVQAAGLRGFTRRAACTVRECGRRASLPAGRGPVLRRGRAGRLTSGLHRQCIAFNTCNR
jgi:hypothetical protein